MAERGHALAIGEYPVKVVAMALLDNESGVFQFVQRALIEEEAFVAVLLLSPT